MSRLGWAALLGACVTGAALALASRPLTVAGVGLLLAVVLVWLWMGAARGRLSLDVLVEPRPAVEGDAVRLAFRLRRASRVPVGSVAVRGDLGKHGPLECRLTGRRGDLRGAVGLGRLPRGRYTLERTRVLLGDHLGLGLVTIPVDVRIAVVVHPRLVELDALFSDVGRHGSDGRRLLLRRPVGFDLHSVREYEQGESLRRVHWPTTARRGQLMVKELQDSPRDAVAVLLDCDPAGDGPGFDTSVRAAGSILRALVRRGQRTLLVTTGIDAAVVPVRALDGDFGAALDVLAAAEPDAVHGLAYALRRSSSEAMQAGELVLVTSALTPVTVEQLLGVAAQRLVSVVWVDAPSFHGRPTKADPGALRLSAAGIPTAVVRHGDDLATALDPRAGQVPVRAHA